MNILILHSTSDLYGASKILLHTATYLATRNNNVYVLLSEEGALADALRGKGVQVIITRLGVLRRKYFNISGGFNRFFTIRKAIKTIGKLIDQYKIDLIYSNTTTVLAGAFVARKKRIRHIWHIHEIISSPVWFLKAQGWLVNRYSHKVIVVSEAVKKSWQSVVKPEKIEVIYNGIDYAPYECADGSQIRQKLDLAKDDVLIGMIGRVHPWKGQKYFLEIAGKIAKQVPQTRFAMVGDVYPGNEYLYSELEESKKELGLSDRVTDLGYRTDVPQILAALDVFILPSTLPDPLPTVVLEAMAAGKPVVATNHGGAPEMIIDGDTGYLIPWDNAEKATTIILQLVNNEKERKIMGTKGSERVRKVFSEQSYYTKLEKAISII